MNTWQRSGLGLVASFVLIPSLHAQVPDAPAAAPAAPTKNLFSFFCPTPEQAARCRDKICNSPLGAFLANAAKPVTLMSGGLLFGKCGVPSAEDLAKMKAEGKLDSAEGSAAQIKKSEAEAMRYLGTVDCNWWPEARDALINGLGADPNECVRYEAALALLRGCCCNKQVMEALKHSANGTENKFGKRENSWRVRETASEALAHCAAIYVEMNETLEQKKLKEAANPPQAAVHGKGLVGIFTSATAIPTPMASAANTAPRAAMPPAPMHLEPMVSSTMSGPAEQTAKNPLKKGIFQRIEWGGASGKYQVKESTSTEMVIVPTAAESTITPAWNRPLPQGAPQTNVTNAAATAQPNRPAVEPIVPTRGIVVFDANGAR
jgi:hypothetical protein